MVCSFSDQALDRNEAEQITQRALQGMGLVRPQIKEATGGSRMTATPPVAKLVSGPDLLPQSGNRHEVGWPGVGTFGSLVV